MSWSRKWRPEKVVCKETGITFRSKLEQEIAVQMKGRLFLYEAKKFPYQPKVAHYLPDFILENGIVVEAKGEFTSEDRTKHLLIQQQHPGLDVRFVFSNPYRKMRKGSSTSYADWCEAHGFLYAKGTIPTEWLDEPKEAKRIAAIKGSK